MADEKEVRITVGTASHVVSRLYANGILIFEETVPLHEQYAADVKLFARALLDAQQVLVDEVSTPSAPRSGGGSSYKPRTTTTTYSDEATPKQVAYAKRLLEGVGDDPKEYNLSAMSKKEIGTLIEELQGGAGR